MRSSWRGAGIKVAVNDVHLDGADVGLVQAGYVTLSLGDALASDALSPERIAAVWDGITAQEGEIVPQPGAEQRC